MKATTAPYFYCQKSHSGRLGAFGSLLFLSEQYYLILITKQIETFFLRGTNYKAVIAILNIFFNLKLQKSAKKNSQHKN